jgi:hypothetical protein
VILSNNFTQLLVGRNHQCNQSCSYINHSSRNRPNYKLLVLTLGTFGTNKTTKHNKLGTIHLPPNLPISLIMQQLGVLNGLGTILNLILNNLILGVQPPKHGISSSSSNHRRLPKLPPSGHSKEWQANCHPNQVTVILLKL